MYTEKGKSLLADFKDKRARYVQSFSKISTLMAEGNRPEANRVLLDETLPTLDSMQEDIRSIVDLQAKRVEDRSAEVPKWSSASPRHAR